MGAHLKQLTATDDLLDHVEVAVITTDVNGVVLRWSLHAETLYGWTADEARSM